MSHSAYKDYKVDYHLAKRVRLITDKYTDSESNETIQVRADSTTQGATGTDQHKVGVHIALPAAPVDGDEITVRDMGNQSNKTNEIAITASHNIDNHTVEPGSLNPVPKWPDDKESSQYFENQKSILIKNRGGRFGEVRFIYDATKQRWDTSIGGAAGAPGTFVHNNARLRLPATELTTEFGGFLKIHLIDTMPAWWVDPSTQLDGQSGNVSGAEADAWCVPTTFANWVGWFKKKKSGFSSVSTWPLTTILGTNTWHHHQFQNTGRADSSGANSTYAYNTSSGTLTDIGWYFNNNNGGAKDATLSTVTTDGVAGSAFIGVPISDFYIGFKQFMLKAGYTSASLDAAMGLAWNQDTNVWISPPAGTGAASKSWLEATPTTAWTNIKAELDANRPFLASWRHWDLRRHQYGNGVNGSSTVIKTIAPLAPETMGTDTNGQIQLANFPISFYEWASANGAYGGGDTSPNGEGAPNWDSGTPLSTIGHTVLVVGYVYASNGFTANNSSKYLNFGDGSGGYYTSPPLNPAPNAASETVYLLVLDDWKVTGQYATNVGSNNTEHGINGTGATTPTLGGGSVTTRHIKAIPIARTGNWTQAGGGGLNMLLASYFINETGIATS